MTTKTHEPARLYESDGDQLMGVEQFAERVTLLPSGADPAGAMAEERIRVMWCQDMIRDVLDGRYRAVVCGVNDTDNSAGIIAQLVTMIASSQWSLPAVTSYAKIFQDSVNIHAAQDKQPYVLKYDLDSVLVLALLRPSGREHFTLSDLSRGFATIAKMLRGRSDRFPVASVSFLRAKSNQLVADGDGSEPSFEAVLRTMYEAGFRGDVYPSLSMWDTGDVGVSPTYPFPPGIERMRGGSS